MGTRTKNQIVLKKQKCGGFLFKIFEHESLIRSTSVALAGNGLRIRAVFSMASYTLLVADCKTFLSVGKR